MNARIVKDLAECLVSATEVQDYLKSGMPDRANIRLKVLINTIEAALGVAKRSI